MAWSLFKKINNAAKKVEEPTLKKPSLFENPKIPKIHNEKKESINIFETNKTKNSLKDKANEEATTESIFNDLTLNSKSKSIEDVTLNELTENNKSKNVKKEESILKSISLDKS